MQKAVIDYSENPALGAYAKSKSAGDTCSITLKGRFISSSGGKMTVNIEELEYEYEGEKKTVEPDIEEPIALSVIAVSEMGEESSKKGRKQIVDELLYEDDEKEGDSEEY